MNNKQKCQYCLTDIRPGARKCHACGSWISNDEYVNDEISLIPQNIDQNKKPYHAQKQNWIIGIVIVIFIILIFIFCGFLIWYNWDYIKNHLQQKDLYKYSCSSTINLEQEYKKKFSIKCEKNSPIIQIQYNEKNIMVIDGEELLSKCGENSICDQENAIQLSSIIGTGGFIMENKTITKTPSLYVLSFVNKPSDDERIQSLKNIFEFYTLNFGDSIYVDILGSSDDPLMLSYKLPPLSIEVFNLEKNHEKTFTLGIGSLNDDNQEFKYEKTLTFFNKTQFEEQLKRYLSEIKIENKESIILFDHIINQFKRLKNEKFLNKYFSFYINSYPVFPNIGYGRELNEWSCSDWKNMAIRYNRDIDTRYNRCWSSGAKGCVRGSKISGDYGSVYLSKIRDIYPSIPKGNTISFIDIPGYNIESIKDEACKGEIKDTISQIKSNLITTSNP